MLASRSGGYKQTLGPKRGGNLPPVVKMKDMKDIKIGDRVRFGRNTGEY